MLCHCVIGGVELSVSFIGFIFVTAVTDTRNS